MTPASSTVARAAPRVLALDRERARALHQRFLGTKHFPSLDGLRCLAIVPVIWHHSTPRPLEGVWGRGPLGVDLFFAISGFLITTLLLREEAQTGRISLKRFYARRSLRIFPLYYAVLGLYVLWAGLGLTAGPQRTHFFASLPYYATYSSNWLVDYAVPYPVVFAFSWSLATEEQFYLWWPTVLRVARRWWTPVAFMIGMLIIDQAAELGLLSRVLDPSGLPFVVVRSVATPICLGALLAQGLHHPRGFWALCMVLGSRLASPVALILLAALVTWDDAPLWLIQLDMAVLVAACCIRQDHGLRRYAEARPVRYLGTISYGMYLFHVSFITAAKHLLPVGWPESIHTPAVFLIGLGATTAGAALSYRFFERPFLSLRNRFRAGAGRGP